MLFRSLALSLRRLGIERSRRGEEAIAQGLALDRERHRAVRVGIDDRRLVAGIECRHIDRVPIRTDRKRAWNVSEQVDDCQRRTASLIVTEAGRIEF